MGGRGITYLLLHLADLELVRAQLSIILRFVVIAVLLLDDILHLANESATSGADGLAGCF
jgi:hypothetical protein